MARVRKLRVPRLNKVVSALSLGLALLVLIGCEMINPPGPPARTGIVLSPDTPATPGEEKKTQELPFTPLEQSVIGDEFVAEEFQDPDLRVFARPEDLEGQEKLSTVKELNDQLLALDYKNAFAILVLDGPPASLRSEKVAITQVLRQGDRVIVRAEIPGPPSEHEMLLPSVSLPYHLVAVGEDGDWGREITFVLVGVTDGVETTLLETQHFIP